MHNIEMQKFGVSKYKALLKLEIRIYW